MHAAIHYVAGLIIAHAAWFIAYVCGTVFRKPGHERSGADATLTLVLATACGLAMIGFATFLLGVAGLIYPITLPVILVLFGAGFLFRGESPFARGFWISRLHLVGVAVRSSAIVVYGIALIDALPATLPDRLEASLADYSVQAYEIAASHSVFIDTLFRNAYYGNNWSVNEAWLFVYHLGGFVPFLTWLAGTLCLLGIYSVVLSQRSVDQARNVWIYVIAGGCTASLLLNPMFLTTNSGGMIDVQGGLFFFATALGAYRIARTRDPALLVPILLTAGFTVGMKVQFILLLPTMAIVIAALGCYLSVQTRTIVAAVLGLIVLSVGWYAVSGILGTPMLAIMGGQEVQNYIHLLNGLSGFNLLKLPLDLFVNQLPNTFTSDGTTAICLLLMLPGAILALGLFTKAIDLDLTILTAVLFTGIVYWLSTPHQVRYALLYQATFCAFVGIVLARMASRWPKRASILAVVAVLLAVPTPSSAAWFSFFVNANILSVGHDYADRDSFLLPRALGYREALYLANEFQRLHVPTPHVYLMALETLKFPLIQHGVVGIADGTGTAMHDRFVAAIESNSVAAFQNDLNADALMLYDRADLTAEQKTSLERQLGTAGYGEVRCGGAVAMFIHGDLEPASCQ